MTAQSSSNTRSVFLSALWLAVGAALWRFSYTDSAVAVAAWLMPIFMLRWARSRGLLWGTVLGALGGVTGSAFASYATLGALVPMPMYLFAVAPIALVLYLPFVIDRLIAPRLKGFTSTLVLPLAWVAVEFLFSFVNPFATLHSIAYSQAENLPLLQMVSITGMWGVSFVIAWLGSIVNWAWENDFHWPTIRAGASVYAALVAAILLAGGLRLTFFAPQSEPVRVAALAVEPSFYDDSLGPVWTKLANSEQLAADEIAQYRAEFEASNAELLARTRREAQAGAEIVVWGEAAALVLKADEADLIARAQAIAREEGAYVAMGVVAIHLDQKRPIENRLLLVEPSGAVAWQYIKARPVPIFEEPYSLPSDGRIPTLDTAYGRLAGVICYDLDYPDYIRQAGLAGADLMLAPSKNWKGIAVFHANAAVFRAVEYGFSLIRPDNVGYSLATDYLGRRLARVDTVTAADKTIVAYVPTQGARTLYAQTGDAFAWASAVGLIIAAALAIFRRNAQSAPEAQLAY